MQKNKAINMVGAQYKQKLLEHQLRPEYLVKLQKIKKQKGIHFKNIKELKKSIK